MGEEGGEQWGDEGKDEGVFDRLRRLRRDGAAIAPAATAGRGVGVPTGSTSNGAEGCTGMPEGLCEPEGGSFAYRATPFSREHHHGAWRLAELFSSEPAALALVAKEERLTGADLSRALFLDTETTGLAGSGTTVFLAGLGEMEGGEFRLWQGFLRSPREERSLLLEVRERVRRADLLVTFFGKSFDRHRLEDRMRVHGIEPIFGPKLHFDLYYACRRLYGRSLPDVRLRTVERELCGVDRRNDLPGSAAPAAWFDFLAGRPHQIEDVFRHNRDDVLSLVVLCAHLGRILAETRADGRSIAGSRAARALALARLCWAIGRQADALPWAEIAAGGGSEKGQGELDRMRASLRRRSA